MQANEKVWWQKPLRVVQTNLQIKDTHLIDPERFAADMKQLGANAVVFNVGGIYAWYPTRVPYHTVNEYLPTGFDLLREVIKACHRQNIRFIARFDFSKAEDSVYLQKPQWFIRQPSGEPEIIGAKRPGNWSLLMSTCLNGAYRNEEVAIPVLDEVLGHYDVDGVFFNAPRFVACWCENCKKKYQSLYHKPLPADRSQFEADWGPANFRHNMDRWYRFIKGKYPEIPMILYLYPAHMLDREKISDMNCAESQDILSLGHQRIPEFWDPALNIKLPSSLPGRPTPLGIVHSSPGMDWRHTGLPPAEYRFWLAQIPAQGGSIWHSLTGIPETITDKRILGIVADFNRSVEKVEGYMEDARHAAQIGMIWTGDTSAEGWADGLINQQIPFDVLFREHATLEALSNYKGLIMPEGTTYNEDFIAVLSSYVKAGGHIFVEGSIPSDQAELSRLLGISQNVHTSEPLTASYLRFEGANNPLQKGLEHTELLAHRGKVVYTKPADEQAQVLATLVPPFSPMESVGAPPERASLAVSRTDWPLAIWNAYGDGHAMYMPFSLSHLINEYKLGEHYRLLANALDMALGEEKLVEISHYHGLQLTVFEKGNTLLMHLVNGVGRRPLATNIPLHNIELKLTMGGRSLKNVRPLISRQSLRHETDGKKLIIQVPLLEIWECLLIEFE